MSRVPLTVAVFMAAASIGLVAAGGQERQPVGRAFEVASVRVNRTNPRVAVTALDIAPGGRFVARNVRLPILIRMAYGFGMYRMEDQIIGPEWIRRERFDIEAKAEGEIPPLRRFAPSDELALMLRRLLEDRFNLRVHMESRELPVYALVVAREDGRLGSRLRPTERECEARPAAGADGAANPDSRTATPLVLAPGEWPAALTCGVAFRQGRLSLGTRPIQQLAEQLSVQVERVVIDRTGLKGNFDVDLEWAPGSSMPLAPAGSAVPAGRDLPSLFTAVQEQLGLKLESRREAVPVLVIDRVEQPTEN